MAEHICFIITKGNPNIFKQIKSFSIGKIYTMTQPCQLVIIYKLTGSLRITYLK